MVIIILYEFSIYSRIVFIRIYVINKQSSRILTQLSVSQAGSSSIRERNFFKLNIFQTC